MKLFSIHSHNCKHVREGLRSLHHTSVFIGIANFCAFVFKNHETSKLYGQHPFTGFTSSLTTLPLCSVKVLSEGLFMLHHPSILRSVNLPCLEAINLLLWFCLDDVLWLRRCDVLTTLLLCELLGVLQSGSIETRTNK